MFFVTEAVEVALYEYISRRDGSNGRGSQGV